MHEENHKKSGFIRIILPGLLVAATGVGAGDLATASIAGSKLGVTILWAVIVGGIFKYALTEGLARWQLVTGTTFIEGVFQKFGRIAGYIFLSYLILWSFFVGSALMSACGAALQAVFPFFDDAYNGKVFYGLLSALVGLVLVYKGGFKLFEKLMSVSVGVMFVTVIFTALLLLPESKSLLIGIFIPQIPDLSGDGLSWTTALIGGVGGTLTILCYGYWIRESGREGSKYIKIVKLDLGFGYFMTVLFGMAMVIIGSNIELSGKGAGLLINLSDKLETRIGTVGKWMFLFGAFGAVFSSLLGVWQSVPYLFADIKNLLSGNKRISNPKELTNSKPYKFYLFAISTIPAIGLFYSFSEIQKFYAIIGTFFMPFLALALLMMNNKKGLMYNNKNSVIINILLIITFIFFIMLGVLKLF